MGFARAVSKALFAGIDLVLPRPRGPRVLIYHQVGAGLGRQMEVTVRDFEWHLDWLADNRRIVTLDKAIEEWNEPAASDYVVLTFDDGYVDTFTTAFPILRDRSLPFTLYLATDSVESGRPLGPGSGADPLTWDMIGGMLESGLVTIGAHTHTHLDLRHATELEAVEEIEVSNRLIADHLGVAPRHFAYPWGYWSEPADRIISDRYDSAVLGGSPSPQRRPSPHQIHRYPVQLSDGTRWFRSRLSGGLAAEEWVRRRIRGYRGP